MYVHCNIVMESTRWKTKSLIPLCHFQQYCVLHTYVSHSHIPVEVVRILLFALFDDRPSQPLSNPQFYCSALRGRTVERRIFNDGFPVMSACITKKSLNSMCSARS